MLNSYPNVRYLLLRRRPRWEGQHQQQFRDGMRHGGRGCIIIFIITIISIETRQS
jgi:hypothetical protein